MTVHPSPTPVRETYVCDGCRSSRIGVHASWCAYASRIKSHSEAVSQPATPKPLCVCDGCKKEGFAEPCEHCISRHALGMATPAPDMVQSPSHYNMGSIEVGTFIQDQRLDFFAGSAVKYICRAKHKGNERQDLEKARHCLDRLIKSLEEGE